MSLLNKSTAAGPTSARHPRRRWRRAALQGWGARRRTADWPGSRTMADPLNRARRAETRIQRGRRARHPRRGRRKPVSVHGGASDVGCGLRCVPIRTANAAEGQEHRGARQALWCRTWLYKTCESFTSVFPFTTTTLLLASWPGPATDPEKAVEGEPPLETATALARADEPVARADRCDQTQQSNLPQRNPKASRRVAPSAHPCRRTKRNTSAER